MSAVAAQTAVSSLSVTDAIRRRRAVKAFDPAHKITAAEEAALFDLAQQAPSSFNIQHWRIVKLTDPQVRQQVRDVAWGQAQITDASLVLVLCADVKAWEKNPDRYWENAPDDIRNMLVGAIRNFYDGDEQKQRDEALRSTGILAQTLMLSAQALGYDSCPMIGFDASKVAEIIKLPKDHIVGMIVTIGRGTQPARPKGGYLPLSEIVLENSF